MNILRLSGCVYMFRDIGGSSLLTASSQEFRDPISWEENVVGHQGV